MAKNKKTKKVYRDGLKGMNNPAESFIGKVIVWLLIIFTIGGAAIGLLAALFGWGQ